MDHTSYLSRLFQTMVIFQAFWIFGINNNILGPTLVDLEIFLNEPRLDILSYLFIVNGLGTIFASAISSLLPKRHLRFRFGLAVLLGSVEGMMSTIIPSFAYFSLFLLLQSMSRGFIITYGIQLCNELWKKKGVPMQFVLVGATLGGIISPLVAGPFLANDHVSLKTDLQVSPQLRDVNISNLTTVIDTGIEEISQSVRNCSGNVTVPRDSLPNITCTTSLGNTEGCKTTQVKWAYVVLGSLTLPAGISMLLYWCCYKDEEKDMCPKDSEYECIIQANSPKEHKLKKRIFLVLVILFCFSTVGVDVAYSALLTLFGVKGPLGLSKPTMMKMTSALYLSILIGKLANTGLTKLFGTAKVTTLNLALLLPVNILLVAYAMHSSLVLWFCTIAFGFFSSPFQGAILAFASQYVHLTPRIISLISIAFGISNIVIPYTASCLMQALWPVGHLYLILGFNMYTILVFMLILIIGRCLEKRDEDNGHVQAEASLMSDCKILTCEEFIRLKLKEY